jgi:hypothetical protein
LTVQKQSGTPAIPLRVVLHLPPGAQVAKAIPEPAGIEDGTVIFDLLLATDQRIEIVFR